MKKLTGIIALVLAMNFLAAAGGVGYLWRSGHLDRARIGAIREILFPPPATRPSVNNAPTTQPGRQLDDLLKKAAGLSAEQQVEFFQRSFDSRMTQLDVHERQLADQQRIVDFGRDRLAADRAALEAEKKKLAGNERQAAILAKDQGFQDSLNLYMAMPAAKVKAIFMNLQEDVVQRYLEAMPARSAGKIIKEFKTPDETDRIQKVMERIRRQNLPDTQPTAAAAIGAP